MVRLAETLIAGALAAVEGPLSFGPEALLGPFAALVAALLAVGVLWREDRRVYRERIEDLKAQRDVALAGWKTQTEANAEWAKQASERRARARRNPTRRTGA